MTLSSILLLVNFSDFGMGIGMQNQMSYSNALNNHEEVRTIFTTTLSFGTVICLFFLGISFLVLPYFQASLASMFKYRDPNISREILPATQGVLLVLSIGLVAGLVQRAFDSLQQGYIVRLLVIVSRVISLALLFYAVRTDKSLFFIIFVMNGITNVVLLAGVFLLYKKYPYLRYSFKDISLKKFKEIFKTGIMGLGASIAIFLVSSVTPFIISASFGLDESAKYTILTRLLNFLLLFINLSLLSFWPAIADAFSKKDYTWLKTLYNKAFKSLIWIGLLGFLGMLLTSQRLVLLWTQNETVLPSFWLTFVCVVYTTLSVWNAVTCVFLNGMSQFKGQATYGMLIAAVSLLIAYGIRHYTNTTGVVAIITGGMFFRCLYLQVELRNKMKLYSV
jgi:O-antigen/teichoic acid export membrane protein